MGRDALGLNTPSGWLTQSQAAALSSYNERTLRRAIAMGRLVAHKAIGAGREPREWRVRPEALAAWLEGRS